MIVTYLDRDGKIRYGRRPPSHLDHEFAEYCRERDLAHEIAHHREQRLASMPGTEQYARAAVQRYSTHRRVYAGETRGHRYTVEKRPTKTNHAKETQMPTALATKMQAAATQYAARQQRDNNELAAIMEAHRLDMSAGRYRNFDELREAVNAQPAKYAKPRPTTPPARHPHVPRGFGERYTRDQLAAVEKYALAHGVSFDRAREELAL